MNSPTPLDPQLAAIVEAKRVRGEPRAFEGGIAAARARMKAAAAAAPNRNPLPAGTRDMMAGPVPVRTYTPPPGGNGAIVVWFHGGGYSLGDLDLFDDAARLLCNRLNAVVVAVGYRKAPEHPFPAPFEDALNATLWVIEHARELGGSPERVAVAGESAGGNLAATTAIWLRDRGIPLAGQLLIVPGVNLARDLPEDGAYPMLHAADLANIRDMLMGKGADVARFPPSPLHAENLANLAPSVIAIAGHDPLRFEGQAYAYRLKVAGSPVKLLRFEDMHHLFFGFTDVSNAAQHAADTLLGVFMELLECPQPSRQRSAQ
ncbi:MAG: alpha/beta hydrolase [Mesorhizobium sp.]|uniref:alpha/beta hydrolase n=1 Tax=Mesorhizobium sp. TaxID=1871066 RepID=UPI000FEAAD93|nr:alpha/beta hydrolase [Mesorhizobium sp.]RWI57076.1 MAG: alpha/beta hydrolase [Mesorhizobium sp.]